MRKQSGFISISVKNWSCNTRKLPKRHPALPLFISNTSYWYLIQHHNHLGHLEKIWYFARTVRVFPVGLRATPNLDFPHVSGSSAVHILHMLPESALWHMVNIFSSSAWFDAKFHAKRLCPCLKSGCRHLTLKRSLHWKLLECSHQYYNVVSSGQ